MTNAIVLAALLGWTPAGFAADPGPRVQPPRPPAVKPCDRISCHCGPGCACETCAGLALKRPQPPPAVKPATYPSCLCQERNEPCYCNGRPCPGSCPKSKPTPQLYRLADRWGQAWQHADPAYLRAWIAQRNATVWYTSPPAGPSCASGRCGR